MEFQGNRIGPAPAVPTPAAIVPYIPVYTAVATIPPLVVSGYALSTNPLALSPAQIAGNLSDGLVTAPVWATGTGPQSIAVAFAQTWVSGATIGGGGAIPSGYGSVSASLNGATIQAFVNGSWVNVATIEGVTESGGNQSKTFTWSPVQATELRILGAGDVGATEFSPIVATAAATQPIAITINTGSIVGVAGGDIGPYIVQASGGNG
jgi:hypothetical protein